MEEQQKRESLLIDIIRDLKPEKGNRRSADYVNLFVPKGTKWYEKARKHLEVFNCQHPDFYVPQRMLEKARHYVFDNTDWGKKRNISTGELHYVGYIKEEITSTKKYIWVSDRYSHFFASYDQRSNTLFIEGPDHTEKIRFRKLRTKEEIENSPFFPYFILFERNAEEQRRMMELVDLEKYVRAINAEAISRDKDGKGNNMTLYRVPIYEDKNNSRSSKVLEVVCPSTGRKYHLFVPHYIGDVHSAKRWTFGDKPVTKRHGDVGLVKVEEDDDGKVSPTFTEES